MKKIIVGIKHTVGMLFIALPIKWLELGVNGIIQINEWLYWGILILMCIMIAIVEEQLFSPYI